MKFLVLFLVILAVFWWLKSARRSDTRDRPDTGDTPPAQPPGRAAGPAVMVSCAKCGVHLPRSEALPGPGGVFCSEAHRAEFAAGTGDSAR